MRSNDCKTILKIVTYLKSNIWISIIFISLTMITNQTYKIPLTTSWHLNIESWHKGVKLAGKAIFPECSGNLKVEKKLHLSRPILSYTKFQ